MIITFNGDHGSGKSTIAKKISKELGLEHYSTGDIFRDIAQKKGMTLVDYVKLGETDASVDKEVDDYTKKLGAEKDSFVIDSRLAWHFIPASLKIFLKVAEKAGAQRMFEHRKRENDRDNEDKNIESIEDVIESNRKRKATDVKRYETYYGIDPYDGKNYDLVLDTTKLSIEEVYARVLEFVRQKQQEKRD